MGSDETQNESEAGPKPSSRRTFVKTLGISGLVGGLAYLTGDRFGPSSWSIPGLGDRGSRGPSYVVFQGQGTVYAQNGDSGRIEYQGSATEVLESVASALGQRGGQILVKRGDYTLSQSFPGVDPQGPILLAGEGKSTVFLNGDQGFDSIDLERLDGRDFSFLDMNGVECHTGITANVVNRGFRTLPFDIHGGGILANTEVRLLGDYIRVRTTATGVYPAISTGTAVMNRMAPDRSLRIRATVRISPTTEGAVPLFAEPYKGDFSNFLGFLWEPPNLFTITRRDGADTTIPHLTAADLMEGDHVYEIDYRDSSVRFYFDNDFLAEHTTNISSPPHEWSAAEPNGSVASCYLKEPFFEVVTV